MLVAQNILSPEDGAAISAGLEQIRSEIEAGDFVFSAEREDIHMNIEARLAELIGPAAGRLHTARSRNDQVATDLRLWLRAAIDRLDGRDARPAAGPDRPGGDGSRHGDARLHPSADRPAGNPRAPSFGLCRDARAGPWAARRLPAPAQRIPARRGGARRHIFSDRPRLEPPRRSASTVPRRIRSTRCRTGISRSSSSPRQRLPGCISPASPRRS